MNVFARIFLTLFIILVVGMITVAGIVIGSLYGYVEKTELIDVDNLRLNLTSFIYVTDAQTGETVELERLPPFLPLVYSKPMTSASWFLS